MRGSWRAIAWTVGSVGGAAAAAWAATAISFAFVAASCAIDDDGFLSDTDVADTSGASDETSGEGTGDDGGMVCDPLDYEAGCMDACARFAECSTTDAAACTTTCIDSATSGALAGADCLGAYGALQCCLIPLPCDALLDFAAQESGAPCSTESAAVQAACG